MFRQDLKNNLKNKIIYNKRILSNIFDFIEIAIDLDNKLYKKTIEKRYNQFREKTKIFFKSTIKYQQKKSCSNQKYSNFDYYKSVFIKLNFTQQYKKKNFRKKQNNKSQKIYYLYSKPNYFARDCRLQNLINCRQINTILKKIFNSQNNIRKQIDTKIDIFEIKSNNNYYLIENSDQLQKVLNRILSDKIFVFIQKINQILNKIIKAKQSKILYFYSATDSDNKYS